MTTKPDDTDNPKDSCSKTILVKINFGLKKTLLQQILDPNKLLVQKILGLKKFFGAKRF